MLNKTQSSSRSSSPAQPDALTCSQRSSPSLTSDDDGEFMLVGGPHRREGKGKVDHVVELNKDLRVMEYSLVLANGLMKELNSIEILGRNCYFGRYGAVQKIIISSKHVSFTAKSQDIQAFVTYYNELDAAWAIAALRDFPHHQYHNIKVHYGTSRYCPKFIQGSDCPHKGCYFNHRLRENHQHKDSLRSTIEGQYQRVYDLIADNLEHFVEKEYQEFKNKDKLQKEVVCSCWRTKETITFPSSKEVMRRLISEGIIEQSNYDAVKAKIKEQNQAQRQRCTSLQLQNKENKTLQDSQSKLQNNTQKAPQFKVSTSTAVQSVLPIKLPQCLKSSNQETIEKYHMLDETLENNSKESETLEEYIENNIINDRLDTHSHKHDLKPFLRERIRKENPFKGEKVGDLMSYSSCELQGLNPEMDVGQYLLGKIMRKTFGATKFSRFGFASRIDGRTQASEESKIRDIIGRKLINRE